MLWDNLGVVKFNSNRVLPTVNLGSDGAPARSRTADLLITNQLLVQEVPLIVVPN